MIVIRLTGGLGNQMFQFALGTLLATKNKCELKIDTTLLADKNLPSTIHTPRKLELNIFDLPLLHASKKDIEHFNGTQYYNAIGMILNKLIWYFKQNNLIIEKDRNFHPEILLLKDNKCLVGAWQSEKYFKEIESDIRRLYTFKTPLHSEGMQWKNDMESSSSLAIHIRRGDYVSNPAYRKSLASLTLEYFQKAIDFIISKRPVEKIFVFSDDISWCKENLSTIKPTSFVEYPGDKKPYTDMQLMGFCKYFILSNSTFGWWGAWLAANPNKMVIAPKKWFNNPQMDSSDIVPEGWIKI